MCKDAENLKKLKFVEVDDKIEEQSEDLKLLLVSSPH
jgi:hypothetical protein